MAEEGSEQNKSEEASPFKLQKAREKGQVARGMDLGFFGALVALAAFLIIAGDRLARLLALQMKSALTTGMAEAADPRHASSFAAASSWAVLQPILLLGGTVLAIMLFLEIVQLRGLIFSSHPLKPDWSRVNPAKGLKKLFSMKMLKDAAKNIVKFAVYTIATWLVVRSSIDNAGQAGADAQRLAGAMQGAAMKLLFAFMLIALFFAALDQVMVRKEFAKQMRMSRREMTRESREREGEPRQKQKRRELHADFAKQTKDLGELGGSDMLVVNPQHIAVALSYDAGKMAAPSVRAKGRNSFALAMKREAFRLGIPIFEDKPLARALYAEVDKGAEVDSRHFRAVADLYLRLRTSTNGSNPK